MRLTGNSPVTTKAQVPPRRLSIPSVVIIEGTLEPDRHAAVDDADKGTETKDHNCCGPRVHVLVHDEEPEQHLCHGQDAASGERSNSPAMKR